MRDLQIGIGGADAPVPREGDSPDASFECPGRTRIPRSPSTVPANTRFLTKARVRPMII
jgi:hypothetical protein